MYVVVDQFSKIVNFIPCNKAIFGEKTIKLFVDNVYQYHGLPIAIISNQGSLFISKFWKYLFETAKVNIKLYFAFHPQIDGQPKRVNQILEQYL